MSGALRASCLGPEPLWPLGLGLPWGALTRPRVIVAGWPRVQGSIADALGRRPGGCWTLAAKKPKRGAEREQHVRYLVDCILGGQKDKFDELAEMYRNQIYTVAWRYCSHREDALDIVQNVLIRMYRALPGWKGQCRFSTWVHRITMNAAIDFYRRHQKHDQSRVDPESVNVGEEVRATSDPFLGIEHETPRHAAARAEVVRQVHEALPQLSPMQRECFALRHFHGMSVAEVAENVGCSEGSVKRHLFRASNRLRELLAHLEEMLESDVLTPREEGA